MKKLLIITSLLFEINASASCYGSGSFRTCTDESGNSYTVNRVGNSTYTSGYNANTGNSWNESSQSIGNTTFVSGTSANGYNWNETIQHNSAGTSYSGTDSRGNSFYKHCNAFGCNLPNFLKGYRPIS